MPRLMGDSLNDLKAEMLASIQTRAHGAIGRDISILLQAREHYSSRSETAIRESNAVLYRSAIVSMVTNWQTFIEDATAALGLSLLAAARFPYEYDAAVEPSNSHFSSAMNDDGSDSGMSIGDIWRANAAKHLVEQIRRVNSPNTTNIRLLSRAFLGGDVTTSWQSATHSPQQYQQLLDKLIYRRGQLVHVSLGRSEEIDEAEVREASSMLQTLVSKSTLWFRRQYHDVCRPQRPG